MIIQYNIVVTIVNLIDNSTSKFNKTFDTELTATTDALLYNNYHVLSEDVYILDMFEDEVNAYCNALSIEKSSVEIDEFEIVSITDRTEVFFEAEGEDNALSLKPTIKCYVYPKNDALKVPNLVGTVYDSTTIIWTWPDDEQYAHYLVEEAINPNSEADKSKIIAQLPIGATSYTETGLKPNTSYTRRLINYTDEQTSIPSPSVTVMTETVEVSQSLEEYTVPRNYDFTTEDSERDIIEENLEAFHSGIGDGNDLKVYKQMDGDFYQKFKAYFELTGRRIQREKHYDQVGFNYKVCMEAEETIEEQEGEVTFDVDAYPREWVSIEDYMWATHPVDVKTRLTATVFLRKEIEAEEPEEVVLHKPKYRPVYVKNFANTSVIISLDCSTSQRATTGDTTRRNKMVEAAKKLIDVFEADGHGLVEYVMVGWAGDRTKVNVYNDATSAKAWCDSIQIANGSAIVNGTELIGKNATNFYIGLTTGQAYCTHDKIGQIMFTDGFCNYYDGTSCTLNTDGNGTGGNYDKVMNSIGQGIKDAGCKTWIVLGAHWSNPDPDFRSRWGSVPPSTPWGQANMQMQKDIWERLFNWYLPNTTEYANLCGISQADIDNDSATSLAQKLEEGVQMWDVVLDHYEFDGWEEQAETVEQVVKYDIDEVKAVTITTDIFPYTFSNDVTPVRYARNEKRAIIPSSSFLAPTKLSSKNLYDIIMEKVKETPEWISGYNKTIGTVESNGESDKFLIKGLFIQDTYNFADEDVITAANWGAATWEDGMDGTVNTFTDIDKAGTTTYGDDCYLVSKNNYLMIQGYTDAIIYDHNRFVRTELNAYDHASEILISATAVYNDLLVNRKKAKLTYSKAGGTNPLSHAVDVIEKGNDVYFTGYDGLVKVTDWITIAPMTVDLIAHNDTVYESPILNYRFNLEDPDAKTPLHEILPTCDLMSTYLHIVVLHVYYAKNVYITNTNNYVTQFGTDPVATTSSSFIPLTENVYQWTLKEWKDNRDNCWYIDEYIWFMAKKMNKRQDYYAELPGPGMDTFYGLVNGRYRSDNQNGKQDLVVHVPQFNIPTTVHRDTIKIYITITEFYPDTALVSYKWNNPWNNKDGITQVNGDYVTFSSDSLTYKDVEYFDIISTINMENQEIFDNKTTEKLFEINKPDTVYEYQNYYLTVTTDNSDVLAMHYPTEIAFDDEGKTSIGVAFKGVVNATSQWAPRIHNGYYYMNQHEYFAYSEFDVQANFDTYEETNYKTASGYITFDVQLRHRAGAAQSYSIEKSTRSELLQNEDQFQWIDEKGLTLKPYINCKYYREYLTYQYVSPVILFENILTTAGVLKVNYTFDDGSTYLPMEVRSYNIEEGKWSNWVSFTNNTVPNVPLSCAYQVRFDLQATVQNSEMSLEDYMCCYLDWKEDMNEANTVNIVTITDHMTTGPDNAQGIYVSNVIDFGCETELMLDLFESNYKEHVQLYISYTSSNPDILLLENITWHNISQAKDTAFKARYFRYKIVIPAGEKVYWLHKKIQTLETHELLPYVNGVSMTGVYAPTDIVTNFINTEAFEIPKDGTFHTIFSKVSDVIGADVIEKGYMMNEIDHVNIQCTSEDIEIQHSNTLDSSIKAKSDIDVSIMIKNTPYIFVERDERDEYDIIKIVGTPQQFCPITVEDTEGNSYVQLHNATSFIQEETFLITEETKYLVLKTNQYDESLNVRIDEISTEVVDNEVPYGIYVNDYRLDNTSDEFQIYINDTRIDISQFRVYIDGEEVGADKYKVVNHLIIFDEPIGAGHTVKVEYCILRSFIAVVDRVNNTTTIYLHPGKNIPTPKKCKVYFETGTRNNKFIAQDLSLNPIYRTDYKGFIYLTDEHNEPHEIKIYCNPLRLKAGGYDKVDVIIEVLDIQGNPVISKDVAVDCEYGILNCESYETDINGVIHLVYESAYLRCTDTLTARVRTDNGTVIGQTITIINE